jgi:predicted dehydrogenase
MEVYGETGYIISSDNTVMRLRNTKSGGEHSIRVTTKDIQVYDDPFSYFADVLRGKIQIPKKGPYSLDNNIMVVKILEAARESARTGKTVLIGIR